MADARVSRSRRRLTPRRVARAVLRCVPRSPLRPFLRTVCKEVGLPHFSDRGHYTPERFRAEPAEAGLAVSELTFVWNEIWAVAEGVGA